MSKTIDERVVSLEFDNKAFKQNMADTEACLLKFEKQLKFEGASKGFNDIETASAKINFDKLANAIDTINQRFSVLGVASMQVLSDMVQGIERFSSQMVQKFAIAPIMDGLGEYQTQMDSIASLKIATGKGTKDVLRWLDDLNKYADETVYNYTQMTQAFSQQALAGVDPEQALELIKGYMNLAAGHGVSNTRAMGSIMQLNQALTKGYMGLDDWKSLETAQMVGMQDIEVIKDVAREAGVQVDEIIAKYGNFRDSLSKAKWLTTDILVKAFSKFNDESNELGAKYKKSASDINTLSKMTDELGEHVGSTWSRTWRLIIGDLDEAGELFGYLAHDVIEPIMDAMNNPRNELLQSWSELGGRAIALDALKLAIDNVGKIASTVRDTLAGLIPAITGEKLVELTFKLDEFVSSLTPTKKVLSDISSIIGGITAAIKIPLDILWPIAKMILPLIWSILSKITLVLMSAIAPIGDFIISIEKFLSVTNPVQKSLNLIKTFCDEFAKTFKVVGAVISSAGTVINKTLYDLTGINIGETISKWVKSLREFIDGIIHFRTTGDVLADPFDKAKAAISSFFKSMREAISPTVIYNITSALQTAVKAIYNFGVSIKNSKIVELLTTAKNIFVDFAKNIIGWFISLNTVKSDKLTNEVNKTSESINALDKVGQVLHGMLTGLSTAFNFIGQILTGAWDVISSFFVSIANGIKDAAANVGTFFATGYDGVSRGLNDFFENAKKNAKNINWGETITKIFKGVVSGIELSFIWKIVDALKNVSEGFGGISDIFEAITNLIDKFGNAMLLKTLPNILKELGNSIVKITIAIIALSLINPEKAVQGIALIGGMLGELTLAFGWISGGASALSFKQLSSAALFVASMSTSILKLTTALLVLASIDQTQAANGIISLGEVAGIMSLMAAIVSAISKNVADAVGVSKIISALAMSTIKIAVALKLVSSIDEASLKQSTLALISVTAAMGLMVMAIELLATNAAGAASATKLISKMGLTIIELAVALKILENIDPIAIAAGAGALIGLTLVMTIAIGAITAASANTKGVISATKSISAMSAAFIEISIALLLISGIDTGRLIQSGVALAAMMLAMAIIISELSGLNSNSLIRTSTAMIMFATAYAIMAGVMIAMSVMPVIKGLGPFLVLIGIFSVMSKLKSNDIAKAALGLLIFSAAAIAMSGALSVFASIPVESVGAGVIALIALTGFLAMISNIVNPANIIEIALGFIAFGAAMIELASALSVLQNWTFESGWQGLLALIIMLGLLIGVSYALSPIAGIVLAVSASFLMFGAATFLLVSALSMVGVVLIAAADNFIKAMPKLIQAGTMGAEGLVAIFVHLLTRLGEAATEIGMGIGVLIHGIIVGLAKPLVEAIVELLTIFAEYTGPIVELLTEIIGAFIWGSLHGLNEWIGPIIDECFKLFLNILRAINDNLEEHSDELAVEITDFFENLITLIIKTVKTMFERLASFGYNMGVEIYNGMQDIGPKMKKIGEELIQMLINGVNGMFEDAKNAVIGFGQGCVDWFNETFNINSPSKETEKTGEYFADGFIVGLEKKADDAKKALKTAGGNMLEDFKASFKNVDFLSGFNQKLDMSIVPTFDNGVFNSNMSGVSDEISKAFSNIMGGGASASFNVGSFDVEQIMNVKTDNSDILSKLDNIDANTAELQDTMSSMQVTLDSQTLVGELAPAMNQEMGSLSTMSLRGV